MTTLQAAARDQVAKTWPFLKEWYRCGFRFSDTRKQVCHHCESLNIYKNHASPNVIWCWDCGFKLECQVKHQGCKSPEYTFTKQVEAPKAVLKQGRWVAKIKKQW